MMIEHHFDFGSPNCYFAHRLIPSLEKRTGQSFVYVPILLGGVFKATQNQPPMVAFKDVANKLAYQKLEIRRFIARHKLASFRMNPHFPVNTLTLMRGIAAQQDATDVMVYVEALFAAMWEDGQKMDDPAVIVATLDAKGLDGEAFLAGSADPAAKARLLANTEASVRRGTFGAPTFFVDDEIYFGKESLREIEDLLTVA